MAGSEAAWQLAERGVAVTLYEMRPSCPTPAHKTDRLAELVCSNSLKSNAPGSASWLLKEELRRAGSLLMRVAGECAVPGGAALAVDRERFAEGVTAAVAGHPLITLRREELQRDSGRGSGPDRDRAAHLRRTGRATPSVNGFREPGLLRRHQPGGGCGNPEYGAHLQRLPLRQRAGRITSTARSPKTNTASSTRRWRARRPSRRTSLKM